MRVTWKLAVLGHVHFAVGQLCKIMRLLRACSYILCAGDMSGRKLLGTKCTSTPNGLRPKSQHRRRHSGKAT
eukprot:15208589-Alexandrium_andersonii.AAC.1